MGKSTISMAIFQFANCLFTRGYPLRHACIRESHDRVGAASLQLAVREDPRVVPRQTDQDGTALLGLHQLLPFGCDGIINHVPVCTAQGGSGSFKDRKPIGEVRCCESWMAEQIH